MALNKHTPRAAEPMTCQFCHAYSIGAGDPLGGFHSHVLSCKDNPNRKLNRQDKAATWPGRVAKGERIPIDELTPMKHKRATLRAYLETLADMGGLVVHGEKPRKSASTVVQEQLPEEHRHNTAATWQLLRDGGWVDAPVNGRFVPMVRLIGDLPWYDKQETVVEETAGPDTDRPVDVEPVSHPVSPAETGTGDDEAEELGTRPGRLAARLEKSLPGDITSAVMGAIRADRDAQYAALGYYPTIPQAELDELQQIVHQHSSREALMQTQIDDLRQELLILGYAYDTLSAAEDERLVRTNDGTPAMKGSLSVEKVPDPYKGLARLALKQGWTIKRTRGGHLAWRSPEGKTAFSGSTPSDVNSHYIMRRKLRNKGLVIEGGTKEAADVDRFNEHR